MGEMRWWQVLALLALGLVWHEPLQAAPSLQTQRLIRLGQYGNASASLRAQLEANPDDADLHALAGTVFSRASLYADALVPFQFADGSIFYEREGLYAHADALRETGDPEAAAHLRAQRLLASDLDESKELIIGLGLADDYIRAGDMSRAYETLSGLEAMWPRAPSLHGHLADYFLDLGDIDSAEYHLWYVTDVLEQRLGMRGMFAKYRIHLHHMDYVAAQAVLDEAILLRRQSLRLRARQGELYRLMGQPESAVSALSQKRYWFQEHPEVGAVLALALFEVGRIDEAARLADRITSLYPNHPAVAGLEPLLARGSD